ncbi:flagellar basal body-associated FliL family protein [Geodermatophilus sabuli]|uniref:Flagellar protein FliL n=1 Tax=Geodermatophilus sabuli TaxID=1564158 RepID=A0A285EGA9_9ACTN|nr:flagellar basal body-associated FliL family protein [Geodermatophilus sabuli]MBB3083162.1 flagellar FliL protein [Geodermatophilus sabuli]SNX98158.1 flagellar FliL protein [Geodermatophilus sabuli]
MARNKKDETPADDEAAGGGRKKILVVGLAAVLALAGAAYFFLFAGSGEASAEEPVAGEVLPLESIAVNLAGGGYLKVGIALQLTEAAAGGGHGGGGVDGSKALDLVISTYSQAQPGDVVGARDALKEALEQKIVEAYTEDGHEMVMDVYLTEYVTQ